MSSYPLAFLTPQEYLDAERQTERRSEYLNGEVFAMSGSTYAHNKIITSITLSLGPQVRKKDCDVTTNDLRLRVNPRGNYLYAYPDVTVICKKPQFEDKHLDTLLNPRVLIEVLSRTTESWDRLTKAPLYRQLESLKEYLFVAQDRVHVEHYVRQPGDTWVRTEKSKIKDVIKLRSVGATLKLSDIYYGVAL